MKFVTFILASMVSFSAFGDIRIDYDKDESHAPFVSDPTRWNTDELYVEKMPTHGNIQLGGTESPLVVAEVYTFCSRLGPEVGGLEIGGIFNLPDPGGEVCTVAEDGEEKTYAFWDVQFKRLALPQGYRDMGRKFSRYGETMCRFRVAVGCYD